MATIAFTVDAALLRELGERLVGKPHIALAELVKNSFDADATKVTIRLENNSIEISDNGHGMDSNEFTKFWMRIGSPHKEAQSRSRKLKRALTGQKGVGRLAAQFLGTKLELRTASDKGGKEIRANVDWAKAVKAGDLTKAQAEYEYVGRGSHFPNDSTHGTTLILSDLNQQWPEDGVKDLAKEIWTLQPPFLSLTREESEADFVVEVLDSKGQRLTDFEEQMRPYLRLWHARITGGIVSSTPTGTSGKARVEVEFSEGEKEEFEFSLEPCPIKRASFEVRVFTLQGKQALGVKIADFREYLKTNGGIHIYDAGFHLPFYGVNTDWLRIEMDHSHRLSVSALLPENLQVEKGMNYLPTNSRLLGVVRVNTADERRSFNQKVHRLQTLDISVTRDRLVENKAMDALRRLVRTAVDFYATREASREFEKVEIQRDVEPPQDIVERVEEMLDRHEETVPAPVRKEIYAEVRGAVESVDAQSNLLQEHANLLGTLATAGIAALAFEHEVNKQFQPLEDISKRIHRLAAQPVVSKETLNELGKALDDWIIQVRGTRAIFSSVLDEENRKTRTRLKARPLLETVRSQMGVLTRGIEIDVSSVDDELRLPEGTFAEWAAIFQNVFINAANAMLDSDLKLIAISSRTEGRARVILVEDTGIGVDLKTAEELFKPFVRRAKISSERRSLGLGGTGLGLTIVKMIASNLKCKVSFTEPEDGFATAFRLAWSEPR